MWVTQQQGLTEGIQKCIFLGILKASATANKVTTLGNGGGYWRHKPSKLLWLKRDAFCYLRNNSGNVGWCQTFFCSVSGRFWQELLRKQSMYVYMCYTLINAVSSSYHVKLCLASEVFHRKKNCSFLGVKTPVVYVNSSYVCTFCPLGKEQYKNIAKAYSQKWQTALLNSKSILTLYIIHMGKSQ